MATTQLKVNLPLLLIAGAVVLLVVQYRTQAKLRRELEPLRQEIAQLQAANASLSNRLALAKEARAPRHLAALSVPLVAATNSLVQELPPINVHARFKDKPAKLTAEQVESYLKANGRKASGLLAAYRTSNDAALLKEAMEKYPNDPQVAFEAIFDKGQSTQQRRQWLDAWKASAPDNALANYLSAREYLNSGQPELAVQELNAASTKPQFENYTLERWVDDEEAYRSAGYSDVEAKYLATTGLALPQLAPLKQLGQDLVDMAKAYRQSGDQTSAQAALAIAMDLGQRYLPASAGDALVSQLVGLVIQRNALSAMDPSSPFGNDGQTVQSHLAIVEQQRTALKELGQQAGSLLEKTTSEQDWNNYLQRWMLFGDLHAAQWLVNRNGKR
jgi:hypothetical protein